ncbi:MAG: radical SAM family heme chaperone HemW [Actinomycetota bacterium]
MWRAEAPSPASPAVADGAGKTAGAYVHVPFCARVCPYCDFAVVEGRDDMADRYLAAVQAEIAGAGGWRPLEAVFVGGGTPSRFGSPRLAALVSALEERFGVAPDAEVTLEANPEDWTPALAAELVAAGYTRVSFGAQSFDSGVLAALGRRHAPGRIADAVAQARAAGFASINLDLIFGTPGESLECWEETVGAALELPVDHVSCYALTVERGTPLGRAVAGGAAAPDPDLQADMYRAADHHLTRAGMVRYEVSNWAKPGHACRYNLAVWAQAEYEAFGNGAHGYRLGARFRNHRRLEAYLGRVESGRSPRAGSDRLEGWEAEVDRIFVGLRRAAGVPVGPGVDALVTSPDGARLIEAGLIHVRDGRLVVLDPLLTDEVERAVLGLAPPEAADDPGGIGSPGASTPLP